MEDAKREMNRKLNNLPPETVEEKRERILRMLNGDNDESNKVIVDSTYNQK